MNQPRLELNGLRKSFDDIDVLADISLSMQKGEFVSILGPSGAGKSTILQMLTGATEADAGTMLFDGAPLMPKRDRFAFMPQRDALMPWRRIIDNTTLGLEVAGLGRRDARRSHRSLPSSDLAALNNTILPNSPAACASAPPCCARWSSSVPCCCSTNPSARSTR